MLNILFHFRALRHAARALQAADLLLYRLKLLSQKAREAKCVAPPSASCPGLDFGSRTLGRHRHVMP